MFHVWLETFSSEYVLLLPTHNFYGILNFNSFSYFSDKKNMILLKFQISKLFHLEIA